MHKCPICIDNKKQQEKYLFDKQTTKHVTTKVMEAILTSNITVNGFVFNCKDYLQINGCALGTIYAPLNAITTSYLKSERKTVRFQVFRKFTYIFNK